MDSVKYKGINSVRRLLCYVVTWEISRENGSRFLMKDNKWHKWKFKQHKERVKGLKHRK